MYIDIELIVIDNNYQNSSFKLGEINYTLFADDEDIYNGEMNNRCGNDIFDSKQDITKYCIEYPIKFDFKKDPNFSENLKNKLMNDDEIDYRITGILNVYGIQEFYEIDFELS